jgi:hypothetical protein
VTPEMLRERINFWHADLSRENTGHFTEVVFLQKVRVDKHQAPNAAPLAALLLPQAVGGKVPESACPPFKARVGFHPSPKGEKRRGCVNVSACKMRHLERGPWRSLNLTQLR